MFLEGGIYYIFGIVLSYLRNENWLFIVLNICFVLFMLKYWVEKEKEDCVILIFWIVYYIFYCIFMFINI